MRTNNKDCSSNVKRANKYIHKKIFNKSLTVRELMDKCKIGNKSFSTQFKTCTEHYPKDYIIYHRIETSKDILACEDLNNLTISRVGLAVGFSSYSAFAKTFESHEGTAPKKWRENSQDS